MMRVLPLVLLLAASPAFAQRTEVALLGGYTTSGDIDKKARGIQELKIDGSFTWGLEAGHFFSDHLGVEVSWARQESELTLGTRAGSAELFDVRVELLQGSFVYRLGSEQGRVRPFVLAGLGATFFSGDDLDSETKFSWAIGAGIKWFPAGTVGGRLQARYAPTRLNDSSSDFCDPFGFCQGLLHQFELMGGLVLRF
jgi:opacity protein-like surface antigen